MAHTANTLPEPLLVGDHSGADALNSCCATQGEWIDWWASGQDFADWMGASGLVDGAEAAAVPVEALDAVASEARALREAVRAWLEGGDLWPVAALNQAMAYGPDVTVMDEVAGQWRIERRPAGGNSAEAVFLAPLAHALAAFLCLPDPGRTRQCDGPTCTLWFRDVSRTNRRRWCSMAICGNRAKVAAHRARQRE